MKRFSLYLLTLWAIINAEISMAQHKPAYVFYDKNGEEVSYATFLQKSRETDIVLFGELHDNPICHWLQLELVQDLQQTTDKTLILGAEMFETDDQIIIDEFLQGIITEKHLQEEAKLWNNFTTDYRPLLLFGQTHRINFVATNIPRRYASLVAYQGLNALESLSPEAKQWIAPLPIPLDLSLSGYAQMIEMMGNHGGTMKPENFASAQAIKDATMADFILKNYQPNQLFIHFNGSYHSENFQGIMWYLQQYKPDVKILAIASVEQKNIDKLEEANQGKADFILVIPETMTKTY